MHFDLVLLLINCMVFFCAYILKNSINRSSRILESLLVICIIVIKQQYNTDLQFHPGDYAWESDSIRYIQLFFIYAAISGIGVCSMMLHEHIAKIIDVLYSRISFTFMSMAYGCIGLVPFIFSEKDHPSSMLFIASKYLVFFCVSIAILHFFIVGLIHLFHRP